MPSRRILPASVLVFALLAALSTLPVALAPIPALADYPNHLARMYVLSRDGTAAAHPHYQVAWAFYPNLAMDLLVPWMARLTGVEAAGRLVLLASQALVVSGAVALEWSVKRRFAFAGFAALMLLQALPFAWGFLNFQLGLGLALWGLALMLRLADRGWPVRLAAHAGASIVLAACHLVALGVYGFALALLELHRTASGRSRSVETLARLALLAAPAAGIGALLWAFGDGVGRPGTTWVWSMKPFWPLLALNGFDRVASCLGTAVLVVTVAVLARRGALRLLPGGGWIAAGFALLYVAMPTTLLATAFIDVRVVVAAALILPAFVVASPAAGRLRVLAPAAAALVAALNLGVAVSLQLSYRGEYDAMLDSFGAIERGARVLIGHSGEGDDPPLSDLSEYPIHHAPTLAVHYADAFVPTLFTSPGKQPLRAAPPHRHLDLPDGGLAPAALLAAVARGQVADAPAAIRDWPRDYAYLYLVGPRRPNPLPDLLEELASGSRFVLYRVRTLSPDGAQAGLTAIPPASGRSPAPAPASRPGGP